jgi:hypothetical protein
MSSPDPAPEDRPSTIDVVELSDLAWTIVDPGGEHEQLELAWSAALPRDWPPPADLGELRTRLREVTDALSPVAGRALLEVVAAAVAYLAAHPERRRVERAVIGEALREEFPEDLPPELAEWLARRAPAAPHQRGHGAATPRRHIHSRPPEPPDEGRA